MKCRGEERFTLSWFLLTLIGCFLWFSVCGAGLANQSLEQLEALQREDEARSARENRQPKFPRYQAPEQDEDDASVIPPEDECLQFSEIEVENVTLLPEVAVQKVLSTFEGKCLGKKGVNQLLGILTGLYIKEGYVASRLYIPEQDLRRGKLTLSALEGKLARVFDDKEEALPGNLLIGLAGKALNLRSIETVIDQISRLKGYQGKSLIKPGEEAGESNIQINIQEEGKFFRWSSLANSGSEATGRWVASFGFELNNILGYFEQLTFSFGINPDFDSGRKENRNLSLAFDFPLGASNLTFSASQSETVLENTQGVTPFPIRNKTTTFGLGLQHILYRDSNSKTTATAKLTYRDKLAQINGSNIQTGTYGRLDWEAAIKHLQSFSQGRTLEWNASVASGLYQDTYFTNQFGQVTGPPTGFASTDYLTVNLSAVGVLPTALFRLSTELSLQQGFGSHYGEDLFQIGGQSSVRGFKTISLSGRKGFYLRNTFDLVGLNGKLPFSLAPHIALDGGHIFEDDSSDGGTLIGFQIGVRGSPWKGANLEAYYGRSLQLPSDLGRGENVFGLSLRQEF